MFRVILCLSLSLSVVSLPAFSIMPGNKLVQNDPEYGTHKVASGETLYSLSRKYGVSVAELTKLNPSLKNGLKKGQLLKVPNKPNATASEAKPVAPVAPAPVKPTPALATAAPKAEPETPVSRTYTVDAGGKKMHKVAPKQTLYGVAIMHGVTMAEIRKWNNLKADALQPGQMLIVGVDQKAQHAPHYVPEKDEETEVSKATVAVTKTETKVKTAEGKIKTETVSTVKSETPKEETAREVAGEKDDDRYETRTVESAGKITETGMAEVITTPGDNNKFLALHKTAPIGTILQVKNIMNGQNVYVRVIGKLPETGANDKVLVRISKKAYQRLAALDNRFRVEVSYMP
ncbi:LysM peptidoglycan-binding domain-containing protein [Adhaeribacter soli]|uniref:LysM peptidoglycan-binding domain-containing protein n=2 Tax=Adhaeribacter soli TaxID=2607655 RepID=A0A5N1IXK7_9BACT|nr:LysM peptidoglycan-binding domain-containing protein [Adhaeribacter soli]